MSIVSQFFVGVEHHCEQDRIFVYHNQQLLVNGSNLSWSSEDLRHLLTYTHQPLLIEQVGKVRYMAVHVEKEIISAVDAQLVPLRNLLIESDIERFKYPGLGNQLLNWYSSHQFCGSCGTATAPHVKERAMVCVDCKTTYYPRINPCVIVLVTKGEQFLLARHARFKSKFYSCLAGFIEVGETPEQTVHREVKEEVGIEVDNVRYIKSQSWPFPSQLMLGYFADYKSGEVQPDHNEIDEAIWFTPDDIPTVPSAKISVAGELIKIHLQKYRELQD